jgi:hypothetical protein
LKKYVSLDDIQKAIDTLSCYKEEHHKDGDLHFSMAIAVHIMQNCLDNIMYEIMDSQKGEKLDS